MPGIAQQPLLEVALYEDDTCDASPFFIGAATQTTLKFLGAKKFADLATSPSESLPKCASVVNGEGSLPFKASLGSGISGDALAVAKDNDQYLMIKANAGPQCTASPDVQFGLLADQQCHFYGHGNEQTRAALQDLNQQMGSTLEDNVDLSNLFYSVSCDQAKPTFQLWNSQCTSADMVSDENPTNRILQVPLQSYLDQCFNREHPLPSLHQVMSCNTHVRSLLEHEDMHGVSARGLESTLARPFPISFQMSCAFPGQTGDNNQPVQLATGRPSNDNMYMDIDRNNGVPDDGSLWVAMPIQDFAGMMTLLVAMFVMLVALVLYKQKTKIQATTVNVVLPNNNNNNHTNAPPAYTEEKSRTKTLNGLAYTEIKV